MKKLLKRLRYAIGCPILKGMQKLAGYVPRRWLLRVGACLGSLAYYLARTERKRALEHLAIAFPDKSEAERKRIARESFRNLGRVVFETLKLPSLSREELVSLVVNPEALERQAELCRAETPLVIITTHMANWEYSGALSMVTGTDAYSVARRMKDERLEEIVNGIRATHGMNICYSDDSPRTILRLLRDGHAMAFAVDQDFSDFDGIFIDFFGRTAYTASAPVSLARMAGAKIIVSTILREGDKFRWFISEPFQARKSDDRKADLVADTERWNRIVEDLVRAHPEQWVWMHRRWRTTPEKLARRRGKTVEEILNA